MKKVKNLNSELDELLSKTNLPSIEYNLIDVFLLCPDIVSIVI